MIFLRKHKRMRVSKAFERQKERQTALKEIVCFFIEASSEF
jgi:hypothetical protein